MATTRLEFGVVAKVQSWFVFSLFLFVVNVFQSKQESAYKHEAYASPNGLKNDILMVSNDGPTTRGDYTTFMARIEHRDRLRFKEDLKWTSYEFCWIISRTHFGPKVTCRNTSRGQSTFKYGGWVSSGRKKVDVCVIYHNGKSPQHGKHSHSAQGFKCTLKNTTTILVTDTINLDLHVWQDSQQTKESIKSFFVGNVKMQASIHGHIFVGQDVRYIWDFGDGTITKTDSPSPTHRYTEDKMYNLSVSAKSWARGELYNGSTSARMRFEAKLDPHLVAYGKPGPKLKPLTTPVDDAFYLAAGKVKFVVKYNDAYSLVRSVSTDWNIDGQYLFQKWPSNVFNFNISTLGQHIVWVTYRIRTEQQEYSSSQNIVLYIKEPILHLNVSHPATIPRQSLAVFKITCQGSGPISFCWLIAENCKLPQNSSCIPTLESSSCHTTVNHTFSNPGTYCLNVSVVNVVSSAITSLMIRVPEGKHRPSKHSGITAAEVLIPLLLSLFIIIGVVYLVKNYIADRRITVEKADFDFRDADSRSVSSLDFNQKSWYHMFGACGHKKKKQDILLLDHTGNHYGSVENEL